MDLKTMILSLVGMAVAAGHTFQILILIWMLSSYAYCQGGFSLPEIFLDNIASVMDMMALATGHGGLVNYYSLPWWDCKDEKAAAAIKLMWENITLPLETYRWQIKISTPEVPGVYKPGWDWHTMVHFPGKGELWASCDQCCLYRSVALGTLQQVQDHRFAANGAVDALDAEWNHEARR